MINKEKQANGEVYFCTFYKLNYLGYLDKVCNLSKFFFFFFYS